MEIKELMQLGVGGVIALALIWKFMAKMDRMEAKNTESHAKMCAALEAISNTLERTVMRLLEIVEKKCGNKKEE